MEELEREDVLPRETSFRYDRGGNADSIEDKRADGRSAGMLMLARIHVETNLPLTQPLQDALDEYASNPTSRKNKRTKINPDAMTEVPKEAPAATKPRAP